MGFRSLGSSPIQKIVQVTRVFHGYRIRDEAAIGGLTGLIDDDGRVPVATTTFGALDFTGVVCISARATPKPTNAKIGANMGRLRGGKIMNPVFEPLLYPISGAGFKHKCTVALAHSFVVPPSGGLFEDSLIAATALEQRLTLVTRNVADFDDVAGLKLINPWDEGR